MTRLTGGDEPNRPTQAYRNITELLEREGRKVEHFECRIDFGPGYRVYFGRDCQRLVILLGGGSKKPQQRDIEEALSHWQDYKGRKG